MKSYEAQRQINLTSYRKISSYHELKRTRLLHIAWKTTFSATILKYFPYLNHSSKKMKDINKTKKHYKIKTN